MADGIVGRVEGGLLGVVYVVVAAVWWRERELPAIGELGEMLEDEDEHDMSASRGLLLAVVGIMLLGAGGWLSLGVSPPVGRRREVEVQAMEQDCALVADRPEGRAVYYRVAHPEIIDLLRSGQTRTGWAIALCPNYEAGQP